MSTPEEWLRHCAKEMRDSVSSTEAAEATYRRIQAREIAKARKEGHERVVGELRASSDVDLRAAVGDRSYYADRARMYAAVITAEKAMEGKPC